MYIQGCTIIMGNFPKVLCKVIQDSAPGTSSMYPPTFFSTVNSFLFLYDPCQILFLLSLRARVNSIPTPSLQYKHPSLLALLLSRLQLSCSDFTLCMHFMHINFMHHTEMFILTFSHNNPTKGNYKSRKTSYSAHSF